MFFVASLLADVNEMWVGDPVRLPDYYGGYEGLARAETIFGNPWEP